MGTVLGVNASFRKHEAFHWSAADKVRLNDFFNIFSLDEPVPNRFGIDDDCRSMLTLVETRRLVDSDSRRQPFEFAPHLQGLADGERVLVATASAWMARGSFVDADEYVAFKYCHLMAFSIAARCARVHRK